MPQTIQKPSLGIAIQRLAQERGLIQKHIAEQAGFTKGQFSDMMNGRKVLTAWGLYRIARALGVTTDEIFAAALKE